MQGIFSTLVALGGRLPDVPRRLLGSATANGRGIFQILVAASFLWFATSSLWVYPHSLSYFNESIGGPLNGPEHLLGSNVDWGQDLLYLKWWFGKHHEADHGPVHLAYYGAVKPSCLGLSHWTPVEVALPRESVEECLYAVSANFMHGARLTVEHIDDAMRLPSEVVGPLSEVPSIASAGYSICVYQLGRSRDSALCCKPHDRSRSEKRAFCACALDL